MIQFNHLYFTYETDIVLNDINFEIIPGQYVALVGDNGAGKTTLLRLLIGELKATQGSLTISDAFKRIGYVQQTTLKNQMTFSATVFEIVIGNLYQDVGLFKFPNKTHKQKAMAALDLIGMSAYKDELLNNLSGGQQQRVMLARALVNNPELVIFDEPTSGVDHKSSAHFYQTIRELNKKGLTILLVTHNVDHVINDVSDVYELVEGHISKVK